MRTDRTLLCPACALRLSQAIAHDDEGTLCRRCGARGLLDLAARPDGEKVIDALDRARPPSRLTWVEPQLAVLAELRRVREESEPLVVVVLFFFLVALGMMGIGASWAGRVLLGLFAVTLVGLAYTPLMAHALVARRQRPRHVALGPGPSPRALPTHDAQVGSQGHVFVGRVHLVEPVRAPLSQRPCAAFRLVGDTPQGAIDDATGGLFEVIGEGDVRLFVDATVATIDIPVEAVRALEPVDAEANERRDAALAAWLATRLPTVKPGELHLREGRIDEGDAVEVEARLVDELSPEGYRSTVRRLVAREQPDAPLVIRAAPARPSSQR